MWHQPTLVESSENQKETEGKETIVQMTTCCNDLGIWICIEVPRAWSCLTRAKDMPWHLGLSFECSFEVLASSRGRCFLGENTILSYWCAEHSVQNVMKVVSSLVFGNTVATPIVRSSAIFANTEEKWETNVTSADAGRLTVASRCIAARAFQSSSPSSMGQVSCAGSFPPRKSLGFLHWMTGLPGNPS